MPDNPCLCGLHPEHTHQDHADRGPFLDGDTSWKAEVTASATTRHDYPFYGWPNERYQ
jgi:hypothetical protein